MAERERGVVVRPVTGLRVREWRGLTDDEVVEDILSDLSSTDRERDLALRLLRVLEELDNQGTDA